MACNGRFIVNLIDFATTQGVDTKGILELSGKSIEELCSESCLVDDKIYNAIIEAVVKVSNDEYFGLHASENLNLAAAGIISQLTHTAETVKQALEVCCEYANLGCSALPLALTEEKDHFKVTMKPTRLWQKQSPVAVRHTAEGMISFTIKEFHSLTRMKHYPIAIHLPWAKPDNTSEYLRVFGCPVFFNKPEIAIQLKKDHVNDNVITADYNLFRILVSHAEEKSAKLKQIAGFTSIVKQSVVNLVKLEFPTIEQVAAHLNISARTLQRRLQEEGSNYKQLIDDLKKDFALSYIIRADLGVTEIAYMLGYGDASAFNRSFKRWMGVSPREYRKRKGDKTI